MFSRNLAGIAWAAASASPLTGPRPPRRARPRRAARSRPGRRCAWARTLRCADRHLHPDRDRRPRVDGARRPRPRTVVSGLGRRAARLEADALAPGRGAERDRRRRADARGPERAPAAPRGARAQGGRDRRGGQPRAARDARPRGGVPRWRRLAARRGLMARVLLVGCGGRGQALARQLARSGHAVRGTTRDPARTPAIVDAGAEPYTGDPDRIATLMDAVAGVTVVAWLLGSAEGPRADALHAGRLRMLCEKLVDTPVRGLLYEAAGTQPAEVLEGGAAVARAAAATWNIPVEVLETPPEDCAAWTREAVAAVVRLLAG